MSEGTTEMNEEPRVIGAAMSDGSIRPLTDVLGGLSEVAATLGLSKPTVATWWARYRDAEDDRRFPDFLFRISTGPVWDLANVKGYDPRRGRWPEKVEDGIAS